ncbi:putative transcription factor GRF family [Helianthus annuus]|nr:putative transcription factor GRF family [Helianthus annuus]
MVICQCGKEAVIITSWTSKNPGRRFYACPEPGRNCRFIGWYDQERCQRCIDIIPGLLRRKNALEESNELLNQANIVVESKLKESEAKAIKLKKILVLSWVLFIVYVLFV